MLPTGVRHDASAVYAWCRVGDHAVDRGGEPAAALAALRWGLDRVYSGKAEGPVERAFADVAFRHRISRDIPEALLEGFQWDVDGREYERPVDVVDYCIRVGSTVGVMMSLLMRRADDGSLRDASRLGAAMQLTNISRDVGEDAADGRLYLPLEWLRSEGEDPEAWLDDPAPTPGVLAVIRRVLDAADALYGAAWPGIGRLPRGCRPAIRAAALVYAEIGRKVRQAGYDSISSRAWTSRPEKVRLLMLASLGRPGAWATRDPTVHEVVRLVDARAEFLVHAARRA
jgi:phytoene synthase